MKHTCAKYAMDMQFFCSARVRHRVKPWLNRRDLSHIEFLPDVVPPYTNELEGLDKSIWEYWEPEQGLSLRYGLAGEGVLFLGWPFH